MEYRRVPTRGVESSSVVPTLNTRTRPIVVPRRVEPETQVANHHNLTTENREVSQYSRVVTSPREVMAPLSPKEMSGREVRGYARTVPGEREKAVPIASHAPPREFKEVAEVPVVRGRNAERPSSVMTQEREVGSPSRVERLLNRETRDVAIPRYPDQRSVASPSRVATGSRERVSPVEVSKYSTEAREPSSVPTPFRREPLTPSQIVSLGGRGVSQPSRVYSSPREMSRIATTEYTQREYPEVPYRRVGIVKFSDVRG